MSSDKHVRYVREKVREHEYVELKHPVSSLVGATFVIIVDKEGKKTCAAKCVDCITI